MMFNRILVPTAFSDPSRLAAPYVRELIRAFDCVVHVVHVFEEQAPFVISDGGPGGPIVFPVPATTQNPTPKELLSRARLELAEFAKTEFSACREVKTEVLYDNIVAGLVDYAMANDIDLIVMGTHASGIWSRLFQRSVGESVLEKAHCPVLLVPVAHKS